MKRRRGRGHRTAAHTHRLLLLLLERNVVDGAETKVPLRVDDTVLDLQPRIGREARREPMGQLVADRLPLVNIVLRIVRCVAPFVLQHIGLVATLL